MSKIRDSYVVSFRIPVDKVKHILEIARSLGKKGVEVVSVHPQVSGGASWLTETRTQSS